jgi:DNA-binding CsgD family transcriptional regulator
VSTESDFLTVVDNIQAAALDAELWAPALDSIADLVGGAVATTELIEIERARPVYADFSDRLNTETVNEYLYYYSGINPRIADGMGRRAGTVRYDHAFMTDAEIDRDEYYADFVRPLDLKYFVSGHVYSSARHAGLFAVQRSTAQGHVGDKEVQLVQRLIPHMRHALDVRVRLAKSGQRNHGLVYGLAAHGESALLVDDKGRILYENPAAMDLCASGDGVTSSGRFLRFSDRSADARLTKALSCLRVSEGERIDTGLRSFAARRPGGARPYAVSVRALPGADAFAEAVLGAAAIVFIRDPEKYVALDRDLLMQSYALTAAETELAALFDTGASLVDIAERRGVSMSTVRTQLYTLMAKLDVNRQADLARLLRQYRLDF